MEFILIATEKEDIDHDDVSVTEKEVPESDIVRKRKRKSVFKTSQIG